ncbi:MAG TPA: hypothetical protein G4O12_04185 [Dehalococcoidia bacterium]|nr:hypothetical protein [Dehalococcoidia bacterium]
MKKKVKEEFDRVQGSGFAACYDGKTIATARSFETLANKPKVRELLGNKKLVIKHTIPEGMIAVY